jgi:putative intracellular protease/amidase
MTDHKFLFVLTSHDRLGKTDEKTGFHYSEMADPYYILQDHGVGVDIASIDGGEPPADPGSLEKSEDDIPESVRRFLNDDAAVEKLKSTIHIDDVQMDQYAGIYFPGGHGTMWDFPTSEGLKKVVEAAWNSKKIVAAVCHGPAAFVSAVDKDGKPLVKNRRVNCFTDEEERKVKKDKIVPFLLESKLRELGALIEKEQPFEAFIVEDSHLITGQNPKSAPLVANAILRVLGISPYQETRKEVA